MVVVNTNHCDNSRTNTVIQSFVAGSTSSAFTTVIYQPLELIKTRLQLKNSSSHLIQHQDLKLFGRAIKSTQQLVKDNGFKILWRGTSASLLRSIPGVGLYYSSLNLLQANYSTLINRPDNARQALYFGVISRSLVSFVLLPVSVVKVRYESGRYNYSSLGTALADAYARNGWVGIMPTIIRDSLFSGLYYMCYTELKNHMILSKSGDNRMKHGQHFTSGVISGFIASVITNPLDVLKTNIQVADRSESLIKLALQIKRRDGIFSFFDGLFPRTLRRTLLTATTWTFYEFIMECWTPRN